MQPCMKQLEVTGFSYETSIIYPQPHIFIHRFFQYFVIIFVTTDDILINAIRDKVESLLLQIDHTRFKHMQMFVSCGTRFRKYKDWKGKK